MQVSTGYGPGIWTAWSPYCGVAPDPGTWLGRWNFDPAVLTTLAGALLLALALLRGERRTCAMAAVAVAAVVFVSPLCALSSALFAARTVHHLLLLAVLAPLATAALPRRMVGSPLAAAGLQAAVFWAWHAPAAYGWALSSDGAYWLMQATLGASALWFWSAVRSAAALGAVAALLAAMVSMGLLGAILTLAPTPFYAPHWAAAEAWGLGALKDQQLAGLIMWAPAAGIYLAVALWRLGRAIGPDRAAAAA